MRERVVQEVVQFGCTNNIALLTILPKNENVTSTLSNLRQMVKTIIQNC
jgi:hypothetical protein